MHPPPFWLATYLLLSASAALAHPAVENTLMLHVEENRVVMTVQVTLEEILVAQGIKAGADAGYDPATLEQAAQRHRGYLASHLFVEVEGVALPLKISRVIPPTRFATAHTTFYHYEVVCQTAGLHAEDLRLRHEMLREHTFAGGLPWQVTYAVQAEALNHGKRTIDVLRRGHPVTVVTGWQPASETAPTHSPLALPPPVESWGFVRALWIGAAVVLALCATSWRQARRNVA